MIIHCLIINIDNRTDLWNKLKPFRDEWALIGKTCHRISGIEYKNNKHVINHFIQQNRLNLNGNGFRKSKQSFLGELGCYMSHYAAWTYIYEHQLENCLILEDGIQFLRNDFNNLSINNDLDILFVNTEMVMNNMKQFIGYGTQGYIVTNKGAQKLMTHCRILSAPIDLHIRHLCNTKDINANILPNSLVKRDETHISSIEGIIMNDLDDLNNKQHSSSILQRIMNNIINKNINLDDYIE